MAARAEDGLSNPVDARMWLERGVSAPSEADWSDLDPEGNGFDYTVRDWQRLVFTFGETGELIHPRLEVGAARKVLNSAPKDTGSVEDEEVITLDSETSIEPDLANRLDSLLDGSDDKPA